MAGRGYTVRSAALCLLLALLSSLPRARAYTPAPVTPVMQAAAEQIMASLLPPGGVTANGSVAWYGLA